jgi:hypothetical protein
MAEDSNARSPYRSSLDYPLSIKQVRHFLRTAGTWQERRVWADMLNGPEYNKTKTTRKPKEETPASAKGKKK